MAADKVDKALKPAIDTIVAGNKQRGEGNFEAARDLYEAAQRLLYALPEEIQNDKRWHREMGYTVGCINTINSLLLKKPSS